MFPSTINEDITSYIDDAGNGRDLKFRVLQSAYNSSGEGQEFKSDDSKIKDNLLTIILQQALKYDRSPNK